MRRRVVTTVAAVFVGFVALTCAGVRGGLAQTATLKTTVTLPPQYVVLPTANARAIVAARIADDRPTGADDAPIPAGPWPCRLVHSDPSRRSNADFVLHVDNGALLALVNLTGKPATFGFRQQLFAESGTSFTLQADEVKILQIKDGIKIPETDTVNSDILMSADDGCFGGPGPKIYVP